MVSLCPFCDHISALPLRCGMCGLTTTTASAARKKGRQFYDRPVLWVLCAPHVFENCTLRLRHCDADFSSSGSFPNICRLEFVVCFALCVLCLLSRLLFPVRARWTFTKRCTDCTLIEYACGVVLSWIFPFGLYAILLGNALAKLEYVPLDNINRKYTPENWFKRHMLHTLQQRILCTCVHFVHVHHIKIGNAY